VVNTRNEKGKAEERKGSISKLEESKYEKGKL
jgi:hypothetical protein